MSKNLHAGIKEENTKTDTRNNSSKPVLHLMSKNLHPGIKEKNTKTDMKLSTERQYLCICVSIHFI